MTNKILEAVKEAREVFEIKDFPGNFFSHLRSGDFVNKHNLLLFKEDLDKLSGFIGYGKDNITVICVNYKRPLGHQNFTLAHEIGHWLLHKGVSVSDDDSAFNASSDMEDEANRFAKELLYPAKLMQQDYMHSIKYDLFSINKRAELGEFINDLCHKYCLSFDIVLRNLLYKNKQVSEYKKIRRQIEKSLGGKISEVFDKDFYVPNEELLEYQQLAAPYEKLKKSVDYLIKQKKIGRATGEAIKLRNRVGDK